MNSDSAGGLSNPVATREYLANLKRGGTAALAHGTLRWPPPRCRARHRAAAALWLVRHLLQR